MQGQTSHFATFGEEGDIPKIYNFGWYEWVYYRESSAAFPCPAHVLGCCLWPAKNEGNEMTQWVLKQNGETVPRRILCPLTPEELSRDSEILKRSNFTEGIKLKYGTLIPCPRKSGELSSRRMKMTNKLDHLLMR